MPLNPKQLQPLAAQPTQPPKNALRTGAAKEIPDIVLEGWCSAAARCPHTDRTDIKAWMAEHPAFAGADLRLAIERTGILSRQMPDEFIETIFGKTDAPARKALESLVSAKKVGSALFLAPIEGGLMLRAGRSTAIARPTNKGLTLTVSAPQTVPRATGRKSVVIHVNSSAEMPPEVIEVLGLAPNQLSAP